MVREKNVLVVGLDEDNRRRLESIRNAENYCFVQLLDAEDVLYRKDYRVAELLERARHNLVQFEAPVDALIHYIDFPVSTMMPLLCREFGLPSASLEAVLKCEHKYWSRLEQARVVPEHVPAFAQFDPFDANALDALEAQGVGFPFWVKPVKSFSSYLGFRVDGQDDWWRAIAQIQDNIGRFSNDFDYFLQQVGTPPGVGGGQMCLAEQLIGGRQCTVEAFVHRGRVFPYAVVDSIREANQSSFARYQYPSRLPQRIQRRLFSITRKVLQHIGFDNAPCNLEFFWDPVAEKIWLLEINTRISESHCNLFELVDGASHQEVAVDLSLGERPRMPYRCGDFNCAAKFFVRTFEDAYVTRVPSRGDLLRLHEEVPGARLRVVPQVGMWLSQLPDQDSYSYVLAIVWIGARSQKALLQKYDACLRHLQFGLSKHAPAQPRRNTPGEVRTLRSSLG